MNTFLLCYLISAVIVYIYDIVNFPRSFASVILTRIFKRDITPNKIKLPKIFECSLCATTWVTLIILLIFRPEYCWCALLFGWSTQYTYSTFNIIHNLIETFLIILEKAISYLQKSLK